jgi:superkiller protein 3
MTWKQLQQCTREKNDDFGQLLAQNYFLLQQQAKDKKDSTSQLTLDAIIGGMMDLTKAIEERQAAKQPTPDFSLAAFSLFSRLADSYNNPMLLKQAGLHCMTEWRLPEAALRYFERALSLGGAEQSIRPLIEVANISIQRKANPRAGLAEVKGATVSSSGKSKLTQSIRLTDKKLITKNQRPSPKAPPQAIARGLKSKATAALPDPIKECLKEAAKRMADGDLIPVHGLLLKAGKYPVKKEILCGMWSNLGRAWYQAGNPVQMEEAYSQAYMNDPNGSNTYFNLALAKSLNKKIVEAETLYKMAGKIDPNNPKVWCNLGVLYFQNDRFAEAEAVFKTAIQHRPEYARAWDNLGSALSAQGKVDEAIEACKQAIHYKPGYAEAYFKLSALYLDKGDPASLTEAVSALSHVVNHPPLAASANAMLSVIQSRLEQVDSAKASLQRAVESDPNCALLPTVWNELETAIRAT